MIGVWQNKGSVITGVDMPEQPSVIFEGNAQILSGNVFKMWYTTGTPNNPAQVALNYAESTDGLAWTKYSGNPILAPAWGSRVYKHGSTYFLFTTPGEVFSSNGISVYTSSDGLTWTLAKANAITTSADLWENKFVCQLNVCAVVSGIWYGYYTGVNNPDNQNFYGGLATSTDGINWTKDPGNPVASFDSGALLDGSTYNGSGNWTFAFANGKYYAWSQTTLFAGNNVGQPTDIMRWSAPTPSGPWTALGVATLPRTVASEGVGKPTGQTADPCILEVAGKTYMFYTANGAGSTFDYAINLAIADMTIAALTLTYEGVQNVPSPGGLSLTLNPLGSDNFQRADANPIGGNWTQAYDGSGWSAGQLAGHLYECATAGDRADSYWNAASFPDDQWATIKLGSITNSSSYVAVDLRVAGADAGTFYDFAWGGAATGGPGTYFMQRYFAGALKTIAGGTMTVNDDDELTAVVIGSNILIYQNEALIFIFNDTDIPSGGSAGLLALGGSTANAATISAWKGGSVQAAPPIASGFSISGSAGIAGATVSYSGPSSGSVVADGSGNYSITGLANGFYIITPSLAGQSFTPGRSSVLINGANISGVNFRAVKGDHLFLSTFGAVIAALGGK